jgi:acetyltransferase-like isoleucine patch superfamily enzyme
VFTHRFAIVEDGVFIGLFCIIGSSRLGQGTLVASRVSITSGKRSHARSDNGGWLPFDSDRAVQVKIGPNAWIGEGAVVMADVGEGSLVGAGAVVSEEIPANVVAAGNPAKPIKR